VKNRAAVNVRKALGDFRPLFSRFLTGSYVYIKLPETEYLDTGRLGSHYIQASG